MRRSISIALAAATALSTLTASVVPGQAAMLAQTPAVTSEAPDVIPVEDRGQQYWFHRRDGLRGWDGGGRHGWRGHGGWDDDDWRRGHRGNWGHDWDDDDDNGAALALGLFGFAAGAMLGSQSFGGGPVYGGGGGYCGPYDAHDRACDNRFRSYDWCSNTYLGYDGYRHYC